MGGAWEDFLFSEPSPFQTLSCLIIAKEMASKTQGNKDMTPNNLLCCSQQQV